MVHIFFYCNGLDGAVGDLMTLPKSQYSVMERGGFQNLWKSERLPGSVFFGEGNPLPPGSAVIVHSALMHGRDDKPGGEGKPRYFIDSSYCQPCALTPCSRSPPCRLSSPPCRLSSQELLLCR